MDLVMAARLPARLTRRPELKLLLLSLGSHCWDDGTNAYPRVSTIALECQVSARTMHSLLDVLTSEKWIEEQAPPRQHIPRTYRLNLRAIITHGCVPDYVVDEL